MGYIKEILPKHHKIQSSSLRSHPSRPPHQFHLFRNQPLASPRCKTCNIWRIYKEHPEKRQDELSLSEIEKIFLSLGHVYVF